MHRAVDLGCGPGNSTELLASRYPAAQITALDSSADMIEAARGRRPDISFVLGDISDWDDPRPHDVILSNAAFQWVPDHATLFPRLMERVASGGHLAVQMPDNLGEPSHLLMRQVAMDGPWTEDLREAAEAREPPHTPDWYYALLAPHSAHVDIWRTTYLHPLAGPGAIVEWLKGSGLRPFIDPLGAEMRTAFLARYRDAIAAAYPALPDGTVLLPFPRLFMVATRA